MAQGRQPDLSGRRILVVEDEYVIAHEIATVLTRCGAAVVGPVPTVDRALALIGSAEPIDSAVLDINLRGELAFDVADRLSERMVPFVFATGFSQSFVPARFGEIRRYEKPLEPITLARALAGE